MGFFYLQLMSATTLFLFWGRKSFTYYPDASTMYMQLKLPKLMFLRLFAELFSKDFSSLT